MLGQSVPVIKASTDNITLDPRALCSLLDKVGPRPFVAVSINGKYRKGKSLTLNFFLQYLESLKAVAGSNSSSCWFQPDKVGDAFKWCGGGDAVTNGINIWSEPYVMKGSDGKELCILLLDTQGSFDDETPLQHNTVIFALSALLSSVMIMNVDHGVEDDMLQFFQLFTGFAKLAMEDEGVASEV
jgi:atlastin